MADQKTFNTMIFLFLYFLSPIFLVHFVIGASEQVLQKSAVPLRDLQKTAEFSSDEVKRKSVVHFPGDKDLFRKGEVIGESAEFSLNNLIDLESYPIWSNAEHKIRYKREVHNICRRAECTCEDVRGALQKNVTCRFKNHEEVTISPASLPPSTIEFRVSGCRRLTLAPRAFSTALNFDILHVQDTRTVVVQGDAFLVKDEVGTSPAVRVALHGCGEVKVYEKGFKVNKERVMHVEMLDVAEVRIFRHAFDYLQNATFRNISRMTLDERSFSYQTHISSQGPTTTMLFQSVNFYPNIPKKTFSTTADEIRIVSCDIPAILEHAFTAKLYHSVLLLNSSVRRIDQAAFSADTQIPNLTIESCVIADLSGGAVQAAVTGLRFVKNRIGHLRSRALNMTAVTLYFANNEVEKCEQDAISLRLWTNITIHDNSFFDLDGPPVTIDSQEETLTIPKPTLSFTKNNIRKLSDGSLSFLQDLEKAKVEAKNNYFLEKCRCVIDVWLSRKLGKNDDFAKEFLKTSYCTVDIMLARCMNQPDGNILMTEYLSNICVPTENVSCQPLTGQPIIIDDELQNPRFPIKQTGEQDDFHFILWVTLAAIGAIIILAAFIITIILCRRRLKCSSDNRSTPTSDIVAVQREEETNTNTVQVTRTEDDGQLYPLLTNERLAELNERWRSEDEAVRQAACEEIVKLYQTIKRQNNNDRNTNSTDLRSETGLYETIEEAIRRPDLLETAVAVNEYALPHDVVPGYGLRSEYSEPNVDAVNTSIGSSIPYMDATMMSDRSGASSGSGIMVNRPLPRPPAEIDP